MPTLRRPFLTWLGIAAALCLVWTSESMRLVGELVPPLDDTFIHFTYAARLAEGHPFSYSPGDAYSSGATSLSWPFLLAIGWKLGLKEGSLYLWSLLLSTLSLAAFATFTQRWLERLSSPRTGFLGALLLMGSGVVLWGAFSGMEVTLFAASIAAALDALTRPGRAPGSPPPGGLTWVAVMATVRPEGAVFAGLLALQQVVEAWHGGGRRVASIRGALPWFLPVALGGIQPVLNLVYTGTLASSSMMAKHNPRFNHPNETIFADFVWRDELWNGYLGHAFGRLDLALLILFAVGAWTVALRDRDAGRPGIGALALLWWGLPFLLLAKVLPILWHHARYLQPTHAVFLPLVALGAHGIDRAIARIRGGDAPFVLSTLVGMVAFAGFGWPAELGRNARDISSQQVEQGRWIAANTPADAVIAANDIGAIGYYGQRRVIDLEGIATPSMLPDALEGDGSVYERFLLEKPDFFVVFPTWFDSSFSSGVLKIVRHARLVERSISGGDDLVVAVLDPEVAASADRGPTLEEGERVADTLNVSALRDEVAHGFWLEDTQPERGRRNKVLSGTYADGTVVVDSARRILGEVRFRMERGPGSRLVGRFGPSAGPSRLLVRVDGVDAATWDLPLIDAGTWQDLSIGLPGSGPAEIELVPVFLPRDPGGGWNVARLWMVGPTGR